MARHWFGQTPTDWTLDLGDATTDDGVSTAPALATGPMVITFWDSSTGGSQYTDLLDASGDPITEVSSADGDGALPLGTIPRFQGPDGVTEMWADAGGGARYLMVATDLGGIVEDLSFTSGFLDALESLAVESGSVGQFLGKDPDPDSPTGLRWTAPPAGGGSGSGGVVAWVNASAGVYGADRTGAADARAAIQAAIDDVSASGGGVVYLPRGTYLIGYTADTGNGSAGGLQLKPNVWLRGDGIATRLEATGAWATDTGIIGIGDDTSSEAVRDTRVSHLWIKGTAGTSHSEPVEHAHGILFNTAGISTEPDAVHRIHDVTIWDCDRGIALLGTDDQAVMVQRVRGRWFRRQAILDGRDDGAGGGPDNYWAFIDVSSANRLSGGTYAGIEVHASNTHWVSCKSWYCKRDTAFAAGGDYKDGAGWYVGNVRNTFIACEAQDNGGHGFAIDSGKVTLSGCIADSNNHADNISGSAGEHECSGIYIDANEVTITGATSFDRHSTAGDRLQAHGYTITSGVRGLYLQGVAYDNRSTGSAADPADGVFWAGVPHISQEVKVLSAYGGSRATIANGMGVGTVHVRQSPGHTPVTGTTLTDVTALSATVPGGSSWYRIDALIIYRADGTNNARIGLEVTSTPNAFCKIDWQAEFLSADGTSVNEYSLSTYDGGTPTTRYIVADGAGSVTSSGYSNQRSCRITGIMQIGSAATTGTITVQVAEDGGTGDGVKVVENSVLTVAPLAFS